MLQYQLSKDSDTLDRIDAAWKDFHRNSDSLMRKLKMKSSRGDLKKADQLMDLSTDLARRFIASGGDEAAQPELYRAFIAKSDELLKFGEYVRTEHPRELFGIFNKVKAVVFSLNFLVPLSGLTIGIMVARGCTRHAQRREFLISRGFRRPHGPDRHQQA